MKSALLTILLIVILLIIVMGIKEKTLILRQEDVFILTENAYLNGYKAGLLRQDMDSVWKEVSKQYKFKSLTHDK